MNEKKNLIYSSPEPEQRMSLAKMSLEKLYIGRDPSDKRTVLEIAREWVLTDFII